MNKGDDACGRSEMTTENINAEIIEVIDAIDEELRVASGIGGVDGQDELGPGEKGESGKAIWLRMDWI